MSNSISRYNATSFFRSGKNVSEPSIAILPEYTVDQLSAELQNGFMNIIKEKNIGIINIKGDLIQIGYKNPHTYATLRGTKTSIRAIFWNRKIKEEEGDYVLINGKVTYYDGNNCISIDGRNVNKISEGDFCLQKKANEEKYRSLGFFDNKKKTPFFIRNIGIVTSENGRALTDVKSVFNREKLRAKIHYGYCTVQGKNCPQSVADAIESFEKNNIELDALLITRGGGSPEDLMGFSDPKVIEAIHNSPYFTISGIGHDEDHELSDLVADKCVSTPTSGGEFIVRIEKDMINKIERMFSILITHKRNLEKDFVIYKKKVKNMRLLLNNLWKTTLQNHIEKNRQNILKIMDGYVKRLINISSCLENEKRKCLWEYVNILKTFEIGIKNDAKNYESRLKNISCQLDLFDSQKIFEQGFYFISNKNGDIIECLENNKFIIVANNEGKYLIEIKNITKIE
jgi:exodeoxyribonuclease VII large subunit